MITNKQRLIIESDLTTVINGRKIMSDRGEKLVAHCGEWENCNKCPLGGKNVTHVLMSKNHAKPERIDVLFVGEAPGNFEELMGVPFVGPTGKLLRKALDKAKVDRFRWMITNTVACRPKTNLGANREPTQDEVKACAPRVAELVKLYNPKLIIFVGAVARDFSGPDLKARGFKGRMANVYHPSFIMRQGGEGTRKFEEYVSKFRELFAWLENK